MDEGDGGDQSLGEGADGQASETQHISTESGSPLANLFLPCPHPRVSLQHLGWMLRCPCSPSLTPIAPPPCSPLARSGGSISEPIIKSTCFFPSLLPQPWTWPPSPVRRVTAARPLQSMPPWSGLLTTPQPPRWPQGAAQTLWPNNNT